MGRASITRGICGSPARVWLRWWTSRLSADIMWKQEAPVTWCEDWVGASPHGAAVGVFFLCPSVPFPSATKNEVFARRFFMENLMVIVNMFVALLHRVYK